MKTYPLPLPVCLLLAVFLAGCTSTKQAPQILVKPTPLVMADCHAFQLLDENKPATPKDLLENISKNKKIFDLCDDLNKSKKEFIENLAF